MFARSLSRAVPSILLLAAVACGGPQPSKGPADGKGEGAGGSTTAEPVAPSGADLTEAEQLIKTGKYGEARTTLEKLREEDPRNAKVAYYLGVSHEGLGDRKQAAVFYRTALGLDGKLIQASLNLAAVHLDLRQPKEALAVVESALEHAPKDVGLLTNRAIALADLGDPKARAALEKVMEVAPGNHGIRLEYARFLAFEKDVDKAREVASGLLSTKDPQLLLQVAVFFSKVKAEAECVDAATRAVDAGAEGAVRVEALVRRGICRVRAGKVADGRKDFQAAREADAKSPIPAYYDGLALLKQKKPKEAKAAFQEAAKLGGDTPLGQAAKKQLENL